jgi:hypothetical protein
VTRTARRTFLPAATLAAGLLVLAAAGCSTVPPDGTPIIRAVPPSGVGVPTAVGEDGVIVIFKPGDRIDLDFDVAGSIAHVEGEGGGRTLVIDREFLVWSGPKGASISFDDGRTWAPADEAIAGEFGVDWRRASPGDGGQVNRIILSVTASPR